MNLKKEAFVGQKLQTSCYKIKNPRDVMYHMVTTVNNNNGLYIWKLLRVESKSSHHTNKKVFTSVWW